MRYLMPAVLSIAGLVAFGCDEAHQAATPQEAETALLSPDVNDPANPIINLPVIAESLPTAMRGEYYKAQLELNGLEMHWALSRASADLPSGLTMASSGIIFGAPEESGLFEMVFEGTYGDGTVRVVMLDLVVHEGLDYAHQADQFDTAGFDDAETYASVGQLNQGDVFTQANPLSVTSQADDANTNPRDFLLFNTDGGDIQISVFFAAIVGRLNVVLLYATDDGFVPVAKGLCDDNGDNAHIQLANAPAGEYALMVEAAGEGRNWTANGYTFRIKVGVPQLSLQTSESLVDLVNARPAR